MRIQLLQLLDHRVISASELAGELRVPENRVNYHLKVLIECECVEVALTRKHHGRKTRFYTAKPGVVYQPPRLEPPIEREPVTQEAMRAFACKASVALDASPSQKDGSSTFALESLSFTAPHQESAHQAMRLMVANLRSLHEQSRQLSIATETPLIPLEIGIAMFRPHGGP